MKRLMEKTISILLICIVFISMIPINVFAQQTIVFDEYNLEDVETAMDGTDIFINTALPKLINISLTELISTSLYNDLSASNFLIEIYSLTEDYSIVLKMLNIDNTPKNLSKVLIDYPEVSEKLKQFDNWNEVDLTDVSWNIKSRDDFMKAVSNSLLPFNDILYTFLCNGNYKTDIITINGDFGYKNAILPLLTSLKCPNILSEEEYVSLAKQDKNNMVKYILIPLLSKIEEISKMPMNELSDTLPNFAYFSESGEMNKCFEKLFSPITSIPIISLAIKLNIIDFKIDLKEMFSKALITSDTGIKITDMDFALLSQCGYLIDNTFVSDKPKAYLVILDWLITLLKENPDLFSKLQFGNMQDNMVDNMKDNCNSIEPLNKLLEKDNRELLHIVISLFVPQKIITDRFLDTFEITPTTINYTENLTREDFERMLVEIDPLINDFVKEFGGNYNLESLILTSIYSPQTLTELIVGIYETFENNDLTEVFNVLNIDISPKGVAKYLTEKTYLKAKVKLSGSNSWSEIKNQEINWGFYSGSRLGFEKALIASLRPLIPIFKMLLIEEEFYVFDSIVISGNDGYNSSIIPLLEALGCNNNDILSYSQYCRLAKGDNVLKYILKPVFNLIDNIANKPVYTLTQKLPNIITYLNNGGLGIAISNLLLPLTTLCEQLSIDINIDTFSQNTIDLNSLLKPILSQTGLVFKDIDFNNLSLIGTPTIKQSKSVLNGKYNSYTYIVSDQPAVLITIFRYFIETIQSPENATVITKMISSQEGSFGLYGEKIVNDLLNKSVDEAIEWLKDLLFSERVTIEEAIVEEYNPTIIYQEKEKDTTILKIIIGVSIPLIFICGSIFIIRKKKQKKVGK